MAAQLVVFELPIKYAHVIKHLQQLQPRGFCVYVLPPNNSIVSSQQESPVQTFTVWNTLLLWIIFLMLQVSGEIIILDKRIWIVLFHLLIYFYYTIDTL